MKLDALKNKGLALFTTGEAKQLGISPQLLTHYLKKGFIERITHGVYRFPDSSGMDLDSIIQEKLKAIPNGVIGYKTALRLYGLTEELPSDIDVIVPANNVPKRVIDDVRLHPSRKDLYRTSVILLDKIPVTTLDRTIVDLLRAGEPLSMVIEIFHLAKQKGLSISLSKIKRLSRLFAAKIKVDIFIEAVL